ncbi:BA75_02730T0 [Komagataella pastoris]|uniref:BA75_02730T0 n=1 Tax=Komagataella pastoris TaxID=4922 RepID=A0A1B2JAW6_PICPA|nr:BA75_02730T0 [Komagataella pastoris]
MTDSANSDDSDLEIIEVTEPIPKVDLLAPNPAFNFTPISNSSGSTPLRRKLDDQSISNSSTRLESLREPSVKPSSSTFNSSRFVPQTDQFSSKQNNGTDTNNGFTDWISKSQPKYPFSTNNEPKEPVNQSTNSKFEEIIDLTEDIEINTSVPASTSSSTPVPFSSQDQNPYTANNSTAQDAQIIQGKRPLQSYSDDEDEDLQIVGSNIVQQPLGVMPGTFNAPPNILHFDGSNQNEQARWLDLRIKDLLDNLHNLRVHAQSNIMEINRFISTLGHLNREVSELNLRYQSIVNNSEAAVNNQGYLTQLLNRIQELTNEKAHIFREMDTSKVKQQEIHRRIHALSSTIDKLKKDRELIFRNAQNGFHGDMKNEALDGQSFMDAIHRANSMGYASNIYSRSDEDAGSLKRLLENIQPDMEDRDDDELAKTPKEFNIQLLKHQRVGLDWLLRMEKSTNKGGILADAMGLGKTIQAISIIYANKWKTQEEAEEEAKLEEKIKSEKLESKTNGEVSKTSTAKSEKKPIQGDEGYFKTTLIIAPVSLLHQWESEILLKTKPEYRLKVFIYHKQKMSSFEELQQYDIVLTSYGTLSSQMKKHFEEAIKEADLQPNSSSIPAEDSGGISFKSPFFAKETKFLRVILDEAHKIKGKNTITSKAVALVKSKYRWCLTGTPLQNKIEELWPLLRFLRIKPYYDEKRFRTGIVLPIKSSMSGKYDSTDKKIAMRKLHALLKAILLKRNKDSKIDGEPILKLPKKHIIDTFIEMEAKELEFYKELEGQTAKKAEKMLNAGKGQGNHYSGILILLLRLRQTCCHHFLVKLSEMKQEAKLKQEVATKMPQLATQLSPAVVRRINIEAESGFTCPICLDNIINENACILYKCGHVVCQDCKDDFFTNYQENETDDGLRVSKCVTCRLPVNENNVISFPVYDKIVNQHISVMDIVKSESPVLSKIEMIQQLIRENKGVFESSAKIDKAVEMIQELLRDNPGEKIIVFSQFTTLFDVIEVILKENNIKFIRYDGSMSLSNRDAAIQEFYESVEKNVMLLSLKAGNVGLTLTCASRVIIMDPFWNPYVEDQAMDRAHRIGQLREVFVYRMLIKNTVEDRILTIQNKKREIVENALDNQSLNTISKLGRNELAFLFGIGN